MGVPIRFFVVVAESESRSADSVQVPGFVAFSAAMVSVQLNVLRGKALGLPFKRGAVGQNFLSRARGTFRVRSGVVVETSKEGDGKTFPKPGQVVSVHYTGTLESGKKFDSSRDRGQPFRFTIGMGMVIKGWDEGVSQMSLGQRATLTCTPDYAYGEDGFPPVIPPSSTLVFDVELLEIQ